MQRQYVALRVEHILWTIQQIAIPILHVSMVMSLQGSARRDYISVKGRKNVNFPEMFDAPIQLAHYHVKYRSFHVVGRVRVTAFVLMDSWWRKGNVRVARTLMWPHRNVIFPKSHNVTGMFARWKRISLNWWWCRARTIVKSMRFVLQREG